ncbi:MAG TPA: PQQ-binding-like beta-propeller repeat protein, partial [Planctomycetota bacterium]|nr:PQQ-binding-like beta-propeller repeat protein [Planctomycetota bacterium]
MKVLSPVVGLAVAVVFALTAFAQERDGSPVVGWRGDGTGKYPKATPPLRWGRISKSVRELSAQARKPADDAPPADGDAIADGVIRRWLVLGPLPIPEGERADEVLPDAATLTPDEGEKTGDQTWRAVTLDTHCIDFCRLMKTAPDAKGQAAYACTYLYSPSERSVGLNVQFQGQGTNRVWLNGAALYTSGRNVDLGPGVRLVLPLRKGWNRLLVLNAKTQARRRSWWSTCSLYGDETSDHETHGIVWMTRIPSPGGSAPVIAADRLFLTSETGSLVCVNKADGRILWIRSLTYHDFATDDERAANPEVFAELAPLVEKLKQLDQSDLATPWKPPALEKDRRDSLERQIFSTLRKVSPDKYNNLATWGCEAGFSACTPLTDGQRVWTLFGTGIVACYDLDGNRLWMRLLKHRTIEHGYTTSPLLVDRRLVVYFDDFTVLDAKTGAVLVERPHFEPKRYNRWYMHFHGTGCLLQAGDEKVLYYLNGEFVRLSDGRTLSLDPAKLAVLGPRDWTEGYANRIASPVVEDGVAYKIVRNEGGGVSFRLPPLEGDKVNPEVLREMPFNTDRFPYFYEPFYCASPLLHEGLLYCVNSFGVLTVVDVAAGEVVYQRLLDLEIFMPYNGPGLLKGGASAGPTLGGKHIYIWGNQGTCVVLE